MPPADNSIEAKYRYANRLLAALTLQAGGELRIPMKFIRSIEEENGRQALMEDSNFETQELVLSLFTKHAAFYPVESECLDSPKPRSVTSQTIPPSSPPPPDLSAQPPRGRPPLTEQQLGAIAQKVRQMQIQAAMKRGREQATSSEASDVNFPV